MVADHYDYLFIAGQPIDHVDHFKHLGTISSSCLKWYENSDRIKFISPILDYNIKL